MASCHTHAALVSAVSAAPSYFRAERLGREKVLRVVGLNPTGITMGVQLSQLHLFILGGYGILPYPRSLSFSSLLNLFILEQKDLVEKKF